MAYICTICKTPTQREGHCVLCGWVKTITISESQVRNDKDKADLNFVSIFWSSNGMGRVGEEVLLALDRMGIKIKVLPDYIDRSGLQPRTLELVDTANSFQDADTTLYYAVPTILPRNVALHNYLHIDWDTTKAPASWVDKINKYIDKVYPSTKFVKDVFEKSGVLKPMITVNHGVRADRFPKMTRNWNGQYTFLTFGDLSVRKGVDVVIEAFREAFSRQDDVRLIVKSNHDLEWGKLSISPDNRVEVITDRYDHDQLLKLMERSNCYIAASRAEGFGLPALEAMATGMPVIIHRWSGLASLANKKYNFPIGSDGETKAEAFHYPPEYQKDGGIGNWMNPDRKELVMAMKMLYKHRQIGKETGEKAAKWVREKWDWDRQVRKMWIDMSESTMPSLQVSSVKEAPKENEWGNFYEQARITKDFAQRSCSAHKELFWILQGLYPKKIIEAGCGPATMSGFLSLPERKISGVAINNHQFREIIAVDNDDKVLEIAGENLKQFGKVKLVNADSFVYPESADVVFSQGMLEHLSDDEMKRVVDNQLKEAPVVIHSVPNNDYPKQDFGNERLLTDEQYRQIFAGYDLTIYRYWKEADKKRMTILAFKRPDESFPKVSIIMPVFNNLKYTKDAIEAVKSNTVGNYELIVLDNHSTDGTGEWLDSQSDLRVVHFTENLGVPAAKNIGIVIARGDFICFLDNDTRVGEGWLGQLMSVFEDKTVGFTAHEGYFINKETGWFLDKKVDKDELVDWSPHSVFMFPRRVVNEIGLLTDSNLWCAEDVVQCCKLRQMGYKGKLPVDGVNVWHKQGLTARKMELARNENFLKICDRVWKEWAGFIKSRRLTSKIDIGSGYRPEIGYLHVDIQNWPSVEILGKAEELPLLDSSVGEIHSSHLIEHFTAKQLDKVLAEWHRVLEDGGTMVVSCPDILKVCEKLVKGTVDYNLGVSWIYGGQRDDYDFHYWSYCFRTLKEKLEASGFVEVTQLPDVDDWLKVRAVCKKDGVSNGSAREISQNDLKVLFRGTHYHIFGGGENMTFGVIKMLSELYPSLEVDIDLTKIDPKKAFDIDLGKLKPKTSRLSDLFISISHFSLPSPEGKKNIAVVFYPQYDWSKEIKRYDKVVAISEFSAKAVREKWKISPVVIPPSVDVSKFRVGEKKKQIISVGRFFWQEGGNNKNQHILIKAFSQMPNDWKLILVGSVQNQAYYDTLKKMARGMKVEFIHDIPFEDLANLYAESELFWSATGYGVDRPSSQEHFGIVAVEALASGCKTVVFNGGGMREIAGVQVWDTPQELVKISLEKGHDPKFLADGVKRYSPMVVREQWRELISGLVEGR